ncbi:MAG: MgtC/SapB family protein [Syntrophomonadaceae bacterium]|jgi:putative Mg2+ transporter-C (MgtC) family protein|nr:MgtC/SapB family protein [Syntrophomonadaceae bacterium]
MPYQPGMADLVLQLLLAILVGTVMGLVAGAGQRGLEIRTYILVTMGTVLLTSLSLRMAVSVGPPWMSDPARISAQAISALGFLGTGVIWWASDPRARGIWAAAALWLAAILGIMLGTGRIRLAVLALTLIIAALFLVHSYLRRRESSRPRRPS